MTTTTNRKGSRANAEEHGAAQRLRILNAARQRFIEQGFHAATMESIAQLAGVSTGLSYRYFQNKRALVLALIEQNLEEDQRGLATLPASTGMKTFVDELAALYESGGGDSWNAVLFSEITAAGARDEEIQKKLVEAEALANDDFVQWLKLRDKEKSIKRSAEDARVRALLMRCLFSGLVVRSTREPDLDLGLLKAMLRRVLPLVLGDGMDNEPPRKKT
ncbi:TetR/AcrR family transcriptional regulator [Dyella sp. C9]|uniref:TetR/AcrR family transcriptional regulator n=1 Tax=Dyella sp. C9 TaxID=2202154 RepID=UPI0013007691|nr:TetR/AcrR family transcriptional regulator [Dyella sp. C9]